MIRALILCALVAGVGGADAWNCLPPDCSSSTFTFKGRNEADVLNANHAKGSYICRNGDQFQDCSQDEFYKNQAPAYDSERIEKLEKRVADLADLEDSIRFLIEAHLAQLEIVAKIEKRVAEFETMGPYMPVYVPKIKVAPFGHETDSQGKSE